MMQENRNDIDRKGKFVTLPGLREAVIEYLVECGGYKQEDVENALPVYFHPATLPFAEDKRIEPVIERDFKGENYEMHVCQLDTAKIGFPVKKNFHMYIYYRISDVPNQSWDEFLKAKAYICVPPLDILKIMYGWD